MKPQIIVSLLLFIFFSGYGGAEAQKPGIKPVYFWVAYGCPGKASHPEKKYGFIIRDRGCIMTKSIQKHNARVVQKIDKKRGKGWMESYLNSGDWR
jgi:hypothetical protein